jgi:hypothetical protein
MFFAPPPTKVSWVYDDPSGLPDRIAGDRVPPRRGRRSEVRRPLRIVHQES